MAIPLFMDEEVTGASTDELGATLTFVAGESYLFTFIGIADGAADTFFGWVLDSDSADTNIAQTDFVFTTGTAQAQAPTRQRATYTTTSAGRTEADGGVCVSRLRVTVVGTALHCEYERNGPTQALASDSRYFEGRIIYDSGTLPTTLGVLCDRTGMAVGSTIKGVKLT